MDPRSYPLNVVLPPDHPSHLEIQAKIASPVPPGDLVDRGGPVIANVEVTTVFIGDVWNTSPLSDTRDKLNAFVDALVDSTYIDRLAIYRVHRGQRVGTMTTADVLAAMVTDADLRAIINGLAPGTIATNANTLIVLFTPPGTKVDASSFGAGMTCANNCGYHEHIAGLPYVVIPELSDCLGCLIDRDPAKLFETTTSVLSHELCEALTDPLRNCWYNNDGNEIGDLCAWRYTTLGPYTVQQEWINGSGCT